MRNIFLLFVVLSLLFTSCKSTKSISADATPISRISVKKLNTLIEKNHFDHSSFTAKARVNFDKQSFTANFRMLKDSVIWISLTGPFNIEGARVLITPTRFQMINKLEGSYYDMPLSFIEKYIPIKADFSLIEDLILGNLLEKEIKKQKVEISQNAYLVNGDLPNLETRYTILKDGKTQAINIQDETHSKMVSIAFEKYEKVDNQEFALKRNFLILDGDKKFILDLKFYKFKEEFTDFPFSVPASYTKYN